MADWEEESSIFDGVHAKFDRRKKLKLAIASACSAATAVEQIINLSPASLGLGPDRSRLRDRNRDRDQDDDLNALFFHSAMLSASLALSTDSGWWVKPRSPAWFDKFLLEVRDPQSWIDAFKMTRETFLWICDELQPLLNKKVTTFRSPIPVPCRLGAALYRLTRGADLHVIGDKFGIGVSSSQSCVIDVVKAINQHFGSCLKFPEGERFRESVAGFMEKSEMPDCVGAIGVTKVQVMASGDLPTCSIALQGVCDTSYRFLDVYCSAQRDETLDPQSPGVVKVGENLINASMTYLVGGDEYPMLPWLLTRYREIEAPVMAGSFNRRHARAVVYIDRSFEILKDTFEILARCVKHNVNFVPKVITACCVLHNVLLDRNEIPIDGIVQGLKPAEGIDLQHQQQQQQDLYRSLEEQQSYEFRDQLAEMFFRRDF